MLCDMPIMLSHQINQNTLTQRESLVIDGPRLLIHDVHKKILSSVQD